MNKKNQLNQEMGFVVEQQFPLVRPMHKVMQGKYCLLQPLDINLHAAKLLESLTLGNQGESWTYLPYGPFADTQEFAAALTKIMADSDTLLYAILDASTRLPIGIAGYLRINPEHGVIEVGHLHFSPLLKKTPAATEAMYLMMRYIFDDLHYRRYEWKCNALNAASKQAALRFGFKFEGVFRQSNVFKKRNRDTAWFSIIDCEWPAIKQRFEKWLDVKNFNADGSQIKKLNPTQKINHRSDFNR